MGCDCKVSVRRSRGPDRITDWDRVMLSRKSAAVDGSVDDGVGCDKLAGARQAAAPDSA